MYRLQVDRLKTEAIPPQLFSLNEEQQRAVTEIDAHFTDKDAVLLHGVTSSGKTHVYVHYIEQALSQGKQGFIPLARNCPHLSNCKTHPTLFW